MFSKLRGYARIIRDEKATSANTALRIGDMYLSIIDAMEEQGEASVKGIAEAKELTEAEIDRAKGVEEVLTKIVAQHQEDINGMKPQIQSLIKGVLDNANAIDAVREYIDKLFTLDEATETIKTKYNFSSEKSIATKGVGSSSGGGGNSYGRLDDWTKYDASKGDVLSALLGYGLKSDIATLTSKFGNYFTKNETRNEIVAYLSDFNNEMIVPNYSTKNEVSSLADVVGGIGSRVSTLEGKATAVSFAQTLTGGKQIGVISIDGKNTTLFAPAGYAWGEITSRPTKLSDFTDDVVSGKYLPLSGGTLSGNFNIGADSASTTNQYYLRMWKEENSQRHRAMLYVSANGTSLSYYNKTSGLLTQLVLGESSYKIGTAYTLYDIIHSGNIGSQSVSYATSAGDADTLDGVQLHDVAKHIFGIGTYKRLPSGSDLNNIDFGVWGTLDNTSYTNAPQTNFGLIQLGLNTSYRGQLLLGWGSKPSLLYRGQYYKDGSVPWSTWRELAFTDSTVANSAAISGVGINGLTQTKRITLPYGKLARITSNGMHNILISIRGTNGGRCALAYYSGYGAGTDVRNTFKVIYSSHSYGFFFNGSSEQGAIYVVNNYTQGEDYLEVTEFCSTSTPVVNIVDSLPSGSINAYVNDNVLATLSSNVASADKLSTARTIWGQRFDGTGNVSGNLSLGTSRLMFADSSNTDYQTMYLSDTYGLYIGDGTSSKYNTSIWGDNLQFITGTNGQVRLCIKNNGNVGIGTSSPSAKLHVEGTSTFRHAILADRYNGQGNTSGASLIINKGGKYFGIGPSNENVSILSMGLCSDIKGTWDTEVISIIENGNVGIGVKYTTYKLHVDGTFNASGAVTLGSTLSVASGITSAGAITIKDTVYGIGATGVIRGSKLISEGAVEVSGAATLGSTLSVGGYLSFGQYGCRLQSDFTQSYRTTIFGNSDDGSRLRVVRTDVTIDNLSKEYGNGLAWGSADTNGYLAVAYNTNYAFIGGGNADKLNWSAQLFHNKMHINPNATQSYNLGDSTKRWLGIYGISGNFSDNVTVGGNTTIGGTLTINGVKIEAKDGDLFINGNVAASGSVATKGIGTSSGGGSGTIPWSEVPMSILPANNTLDLGSNAKPWDRVFSSYFGTDNNHTIITGTSVTIVSDLYFSNGIDHIDTNGNAYLHSIYMDDELVATEAWVNNKLGAAASYGIGYVQSGNNGLVTGNSVYVALTSYESDVLLAKYATLANTYTKTQVNNNFAAKSEAEIVYSVSVTGDRNVAPSLNLDCGNGVWSLRNAYNGSNGDLKFLFDEQQRAQLTPLGDLTISGRLTQSSDETLKNILGYNVDMRVKDIANAPICYFTWKDRVSDRQIGTIAQYWKLITPECVVGEEGRMSMDYSTLGLVSSIVNAREIIKHEDEIGALKKRVKELENEIAALKAA